MKWISVKDRLPEDGESTFIYATPSSRGGYAVGIGYRAVNGTYRTETGGSETHMTHWMPLPPPPEEE